MSTTAFLPCQEETSAIWIHFKAGSRKGGNQSAGDTGQHLPFNLDIFQEYEHLRLG